MAHEALFDLRDAAAMAARYPLLVAHRGGVIAPEAPEDSLAAICLAGSRGYDMVELDVTRPKDDEPVLFHDWTGTLLRVTAAGVRAYSSTSAPMRRGRESAAVEQVEGRHRRQGRDMPGAGLLRRRAMLGWGRDRCRARARRGHHGRPPRRGTSRVEATAYTTLTTSGDSRRCLMDGCTAPREGSDRHGDPMRLRHAVDLATRHSSTFRNPLRGFSATERMRRSP